MRLLVLPALPAAAQADQVRLDGVTVELRHGTRQVVTVNPTRGITNGDDRVQDNTSRFCNRYRNKRQGGFRWGLSSSDANSSERLLDHRRECEVAVVIGFNPAQVRHRGAGILLHVNGGGATTGCVSVPRKSMTTPLKRLDPDHEPLIAVGR